MGAFKKNINTLRKHILLSLTENIGSLDANFAQKFDKDSIRNILIVRPNHRLGNQLLATPLVQEITATFPNAHIDLFTGKVAPILFANYSQIDRILRIPRKPFKELGQYLKVWLQLRSKNYDFVYNVDRTSSSGRLATKFSRGKIKMYGEILDSIIKKHPEEYKHNAKYPVFYLREILSSLGFETSTMDVPFLDLKLSDEELKNGKILKDSLVKDPSKPTITLYTFATGAKCYSEAWWKDFYQQLMVRYPEYNLLEILPVENVSMISFQAPALYSKDVREMAAVMANTAIYIGADCGVMHLASAANVPTIGFFSITEPCHYGPYNTGSKGLITTNLKTEEIFEELDQILKK
jgi:heptosyltransferase III